MDRMERTELTVVCLVTRGDELLLQNRAKNDWQGYTLPGGHVEPGESIVDAVVREMKEETGLTVLDPALCGIKQFPVDGGRYLVFLFRASRFEGTLTSSCEGAMEWVARAQLHNYKTAADFPELLRVMESSSLSEFQYVIENGQWKVELR